MYTPYRRILQSVVMASIFAVPVLNIYEIYSVTGTLYALNFGGLGVADPAVILQAVFAAGELTVPLLNAVLFPLFVAILFGRIWCGWFCPFLFLAEGADWLRNKIGFKWWPRVFGRGVWLQNPLAANVARYVFLVGGTALAGAIAVPVLNYVNAPGILSTEAMIFVKERTVSIEFGFIVVLFVLQATVLPKMWCRLLCPTGAVISLFRSPISLRVISLARQTTGPCCRENTCTSVCPMGLAPFLDAGNLLCVNCGRCIESCRLGNLAFSGFELRAGSPRR